MIKKTTKKQRCNPLEGNQKNSYTNTVHPLDCTLQGMHSPTHIHIWLTTELDLERIAKFLNENILIDFVKLKLENRFFS